MACVGEMKDALFLSVVHPFKLSAAADGPVHGVGGNAQLPLHLLTQLQRIPGLPVHLVHKGKNGDVPQGTDLEELPGLGLHALGPVNDHHSAVSGHKGAVGILGKVLMAGGVQNIDAEAVVAELHHRRGNRDTALLFDLHPVGGGGPGALALDLTGLGDSPAVEQEFLRQCSFTGVRVRNDGECPPPGNFFF